MTNTYRWFTLVLVSTGMMAFSGCTTSSGFFPTRVAVATTPTGSAVSINGQSAGVAPLNVWFAPSRAHLIVAQKEGWARTALLVLPPDDGKPLRCFSWSADAPLSEWVDFTPDPIELWLRAPDVGDPLLVLMDDIRKTDDMKASGHLSVWQHRELTRALADFFDPPHEMAGQ